MARSSPGTFLAPLSYVRMITFSGAPGYELQGVVDLIQREAMRINGRCEMVLLDDLRDPAQLSSSQASSQHAFVRWHPPAV